MTSSVCPQDGRLRAACARLFVSLSPLALPGLIACLGLIGPGQPATASPPRDPDPPAAGLPTAAEQAALRRFRKSMDRPNTADAARIRQRRQHMEAVERRLRALSPSAAVPSTDIAADIAADEAAADAAALTGIDRVLVILVEFDPTKPDTFNWNPTASTWDPFGKCNTSEYDGNPYHVGTAIAALRLGQMYGVTSPKDFTYAGPLHNQIARPLSEDDTSGNHIWTPDFSPKWYNDLIFGNGVRFQYTRQDGSNVNIDFTGKSVRNYYEDISGGRYSISGQVVGWLKLPHSVWWYGADPAPGARSGYRTSHHGGIPGAGTAYTLVADALNAVNKAFPDFNWKQYDQDNDGTIDRLWIIHAGLGEEDSTTLLNRTDYGEGGMWSHSSSLPVPHTVFDDGQTIIKAGPYIMMPENCGIGVLAHEYGHNLGADDLYAYGNGDTSAGFWTIMADNWTGYPVAFEPPSMDPWHLDNWGWLNPLLITDPTRVYKTTLGQASQFPGAPGMVRAVKIVLPDGKAPLPVVPENGKQWWSGNGTLTNGMMTLKNPVTVPANATLSFRAAWSIETDWDFLWVQASTDGGATWNTLTNAHTTSRHDPAWIGSAYGFPDDLAAYGIGGFSGTSAAFPAWQTETFSLFGFAGRSVLLRFWYMTDWGYEGPGFFMDDVRVQANGATVFSDRAALASGKWTIVAPWQVNDGFENFTHNFYLQWRNVSPTGGYDRALGDARWYYGPANTGMIAWYNNNYYKDNEVYDHLFDYPGFGPKGRMLVADAHPEPYRHEYYLDGGFPNEGANLPSRSLMRDAPFSLNPSVPFAYWSTEFTGQPAVPTFRDALGYYPGAEFVSGGPSDSLKWVTRQWDASVVMPSTVRYGIKAPGYKAADNFYYAAAPNWSAGTLSASVKQGLGYDGGTGNPVEVNGQAGWNAKILSQTDTSGTVVVWNSRHAAPVVAQPDRFGVSSYVDALTVPAPGILANDVGPLGWEAVRHVEVVNAPTHGTLTLRQDGGFTYTPTPGIIGSDRFTYRLQTDYGATSSTVSVVIGKPGDADRSGAVNLNDVRLVLRAAGGLLRTATATVDLDNADITRDGRLTAHDAARILRLATGRDTP